jgi:hypothetical protein
MVKFSLLRPTALEESKITCGHSYFTLIFYASATIACMAHKKEAMHLQCLPIENFMCTQGRYVDDPLPNIVCIVIWDACLLCVALLCVHLNYVVVPGQFFCLVCGLLEKKKNYATGA